MLNTSPQTNGLRLVSYCPVCETRSNPMNARVLGQEGETHLLHIQCHKCQNAFLALVLVDQVGATSVGLLTDLAYEDVIRFGKDRSVSINDVISAHDVLEKGSLLSSLIVVPKKVVKTQKKPVKRNVRTKK